VVGGGEASVVVLEGSGGSGGLEGVLLGVLVVQVLVEQIEPVVLVKVQALFSGMGGKNWSSRRSQMEVCHFAHNPSLLSQGPGHALAYVPPMDEEALGWSVNKNTLSRGADTNKGKT